MKIIAKTEEGFLVTATDNEIKDILTSVSGVRPKEVSIGQRIPAVDYASTITKIKGLKDDYDFRAVFSRLGDFNKTANLLEEAVMNANNLEG